MTAPTHSPTHDPVAPNPAGIPTFEAVRYGRAVTVLGEDGDLGVLAVGHDRRALAAINAHARQTCGHRWAGGYLPPIALRRWALIHETCGCTAEEHAEHNNRAVTDPDWDGCPCPHEGLAPCEPDRFAWLADWVPADTPGAVAVTEVPW